MRQQVNVAALCHNAACNPRQATTDGLADQSTVTQGWHIDIDPSTFHVERGASSGPLVVFVVVVFNTTMLFVLT
jgi:hypothetical protein